LPELDFGEEVSIFVKSKLCDPEVAKEIKNSSCRNIVIAGCTPRILERFYSEVFPEYVNIREHAHLVGHGKEKINSLIRGAVEKLKAVPRKEIKPKKIKNRAALVIGAGISGLEVAKQIANSGIKVYLVEKRPFIGGIVGILDRLYPEGTPESHTLYTLINDVAKNENIEILTNSKVEEINGNVGDYKVKIKSRIGFIDGCNLCGKCAEICPVVVNDHGIERKAIYYQGTYPESYAIDFEACNLCKKCLEVCNKISFDEKTVELNVGAIVLATGLKFYDARKIKEYKYGKLKNVMTHIEFERRVTNENYNPKKVVIIHCAGSRDDRYLPYCSRVCCVLGLKEAKLIKDISPETEVTITYIDMRAYGIFEDFYEVVKNVYGVKFINGRPSEILENEDGQLLVRVEDILIGQQVELEADCVVLSTGFEPDYESLEKLGIVVENEFPVAYVNSTLANECSPRGIFIVGCAAFPKAVAETISESRDVALDVISLLNKTEIMPKFVHAEINSDICGEIDCRICVSTCPYGAAYVDKEGKVRVNEDICMGCGICTATCAAGANQLINYEDKGLLAQIKATVDKDDIAAFLCRWSSYNAADKAAYLNLSYGENVKIFRVPCTGRVDAQQILQAYSSGAKAVLIAGCPPNACHYITGNFKVRKRIAALKNMLEQFGIDPESLRVEWIGSQEAKRLVSIFNELNEKF